MKIAVYVKVVVLIGLVAADVLADATWNAAVNGDWRTDSNWLDSVAPSSAGRTYITNAAAAYTVTLGSGADVTTAGLKISGNTSASYKTKLNIADTKLTVDGSQPSVSYGAVTVGSGAELEIKNAAGAIIGLGGKIVVDGGTLVMTNGITGALAIGHKDWLTGGYPTFSITSGNAYFKGSTPLMSLDNYSTFTMTGGKVEMIDTAANHNTTLFYVQGNSAGVTFFSMSGDSEMTLSRGGNLYLGHGISEFKGNAKLTVTEANNYVFFSPYFSDSGKKVTVNVSDNAKVSVNVQCFEYGKADYRTTGTTGEFNISGGEVSLGLRSMLGAGIGKYSMNMTGGNVDFKRYGVRISTPPYLSQQSTASNAKDLANTTTVTVAGGMLSCSAAESHYNTARQQMWGFIVGAGLVGRGSNAHLTNGWFDARVNLQSGGTITNGCCLKMLGVGRGIGTMTQTGGTYIGDSTDNSYYDNGHGAGYHRYPDAFVIGAFGGEGIYDLQSGSAILRCPMFIGGTTLQMIYRTDDNNMLPADTAGKAVGTLKVSGGTMTVLYASYVGYDGRGTIDVSGDGSLTFQDDLLLTNNVANAATIKVTLADGALPTFRIGGRLTVRGDARLVVDATGFRSGVRWTKIVDVGGGRTGSFDPANISLLGDGEIVQNRSGDATGSIWLRKAKGFCVSFH